MNLVYNFEVGKAVNSQDLTREELAAIFGFPVAEILAEPPSAEAPPCVVVKSVDREARSITFESAGAAK